jgi:hypothetical protein
MGICVKHNTDIVSGCTLSNQDMKKQYHKVRGKWGNLKNPEVAQ